MNGVERMDGNVTCDGDGGNHHLTQSVASTSWHNRSGKHSILVGQSSVPSSLINSTFKIGVMHDNILVFVNGAGRVAIVLPHYHDLAQVRHKIG